MPMRCGLARSFTSTLSVPMTRWVRRLTPNLVFALKDEAYEERSNQNPMLRYGQS